MAFEVDLVNPVEDLGAQWREAERLEVFLELFDGGCAYDRRPMESKTCFGGESVPLGGGCQNDRPHTKTRSRSPERAGRAAEYRVLRTNWLIPDLRDEPLRPAEGIGHLGRSHPGVLGNLSVELGSLPVTYPS